MPHYPSSTGKTSPDFVTRSNVFIKFSIFVTHFYKGAGSLIKYDHAVGAQAETVMELTKVSTAASCKTTLIQVKYQVLREFLAVTTY